MKLLLFLTTATILTAANTTLEGPLTPFLGKPILDTQVLFEGERFSNIVVALDGTLVATWGSKNIQVRRSQDGGKTWGPTIHVTKGIHAGGTTVDEKTGDILLFAHPVHPPRNGETAPRSLFRSQDQGKTWKKVDAAYPKDTNGYIPSLHMSEHGITLRHCQHEGRLIRPARVYRKSPERYSSAVYSDDHGKTWLPSQPVPIQGCGEGNLLELSNGQLLYTARRSFFAEGQELRHQRHYALSKDGGQTWEDSGYFKTLPDGPRYRGKKGRGANYNGHFGMHAGFIRLPVKDRDILLYSNADHDGHERQKLTIWGSFDAGKTWPIQRLIAPDPGAYSSLATGRPNTPSEGHIYLQYEYGEGKQLYKGCRIATFNLSWLLKGQSTGDGKLPDWLN